MKSFVISHLKLVIIITCIVSTTIIGGIITFSIIKSNNNISIQSNERNKDKIQIEVVADSVKIRESKEPNSQVIGKVYKNEVYSIISEDKESQYKWLEIETSNGIKGYIVGIEAYVKKLETTIINEEEQKPNDQTNIDNENTNNNEEKPNDNQTENKPNTNQKPNNNSNTNKPNNNNSNNKPNIDNNNNNQNNNVNDNDIHKKYNVSFILDGKVYNEQRIEENKKVKKPNEPYKDNHQFLYWSYNDKEFDFNTPITKDIELKAIFKYISYEEKIKAREIFENILSKYGYKTLDIRLGWGNKSFERDDKYWRINIIYVDQYYSVQMNSGGYYNLTTQEYSKHNYNSNPSCSKNDISIECSLIDKQIIEYANESKNDLNKIANEFEALGYNGSYFN